jgi:hypothetical protein
LSAHPVGRQTTAVCEHSARHRGRSGEHTSHRADADREPLDHHADGLALGTEAIERGGEIEMEETDWLRKSFGDDFGHVADKLVTVRLRTVSRSLRCGAHTLFDHFHRNDPSCLVDDAQSSLPT